MLELAAIFLGYLEFCLGNVAGPDGGSSTLSMPDVVELSGDDGEAIPVLKELSV